MLALRPLLYSFELLANETVSGNGGLINVSSGASINVFNTAGLNVASLATLAAPNANGGSITMTAAQPVVALSTSEPKPWQDSGNLDVSGIGTALAEALRFSMQ